MGLLQGTSVVSTTWTCAVTNDIAPSKPQTAIRIRNGGLDQFNGHLLIQPAQPKIPRSRTDTAPVTVFVC
ncbi:hypothetical protein H9L39_07109 [Fusarium oxysporum f. sp. albedinis]|nr:hypothetical protein H9L39_07109 [Fusarium oxysporum f. sp. albedinis]